ncbi:hypothetical protein F1D05_00160 [Kribbella qitaiheensis]|uniref:Uncharacterized protein n=1 Tax=Kribbella qitaiheensis TaxID=1544730 RepID=A0A7G6WRI9_9ACTN|nr:hypothetical protein [Kribbella qitaiheensis]QNE16604.1 hypothetical protein F1D05_00160 [Kribbella qitaiheensis]
MTVSGKSIESLLDGVPEQPGTALRLSESPLWDRQRRFYDRGAPDIWGSGAVPHGITGNPRIASTYARIAQEFLRASMTADTAEVPHIVEFGGGTGRFAYLFVRQLRALAPGLRFTYVVTDFAADRVQAWAAHPSYRPFIDEGLIDFAVLDADNPGPLELLVSGRTITPGSLRAPVIGIANYVFDTLRHDCFALSGGDLMELKVAPVGDDQEPSIEWESAPCGEIADDLAAVLDHYRDWLDDTAVLAPVGGMRCLEFLDDLTQGPSLAIIADKGHRTRVELCSYPSPSVVFHGSAFSLMVNFDLLARWVRQRGGVGILPTEPANSLVVGAFVQGPMPEPERLTAWVQDQLVDTGPDNAFSLRPLLSTASSLSLEAMLASLRLSRSDPTLLIEFLPTLLDVLPGAPEVVKNEMHRLLGQVWDNYFPIGEPIDMALCMGLILSAIQRFPDAIEFLELSVKDHPESAPAAFAMAVALRGMRDLRAARDWVDRALEFEPGFSEARSLRAMLAESDAGVF